MSNKIYPFTIPANYQFDSDKIEVSDGKAKLKESTDLYGLKGYWKFEDDVLDSSGQGNNGTIYGNPQFVNGKVDRCLSFDGSGDYVNCGNDDNLKTTGSFTFELWIKFGVFKDKAGIISKYQQTMASEIRVISSRIFPYNRVEFYSHGSNTPDVLISSIFSVGMWYHLVCVYDSSVGKKIYINGVEDVTDNKIDNPVPTNYPFLIGWDYSSPDRYFNGEMDEVAFYHRVLTPDEILDHYNSGLGKHLSTYPSNKPTIKPTTSWTISGLSQFTAFVESLGVNNEGSIAYQLSDDDGVSWRYWNGSAWVVTSDQYNDVSTIHTNIGSFPVVGEKIMFRAFLISDGEKQVELDTLEFTALVGNPPVVYAGADKDCYDHQTIKLFNDATISDPDGDIEQASAWYNIEGSGWIQIPKGGYGTLQEAIRNFQYTFDNIGIVNCQLKVIDQQSKETIDDLNITVKKYTVTFNVKDKDGNHLANFQFLPDDGSDWQTLNSPFTWDYVWQATDYQVIFDKVGFQTAKADVEVSVHTENITMSVLGAVSPEEVADAVWDELKNGHTITNSFGDTNQRKVPSENVNDYKADVSKLSNIKNETDKIQTIDNNVDAVKAKTNNLPTSPTSETNAMINKNSIISEINANETLIKRILGLTQENFKLYDCFYANGQLTQGKIKIYPSATDLENDTNAMAIYQVNADYNSDGTCKDYRVKKL